ncbi:MAG: hypothetical protein H7X94_07070, partial [Vallitaleaceae bacterium]|nr:hypothetical protein [Vallitaleaceae bacterium]
MNTKMDVSLMVKVAQMYYIDGLKQEEIAKHLSVSRSQISMVLTEAKEVGIVQIKIRNPLISDEEISRKFKKLFGLKDCIIVPTGVQDASTLRHIVVQRAVEVLRKEMLGAKNIGIAWGRTIYQLVTTFKAESSPEMENISVVSLIGGSKQIAGYYQVNEMVRIFAEKINGLPYFIHAPALTSSSEERMLYMKSTSMQTLAEFWEQMDLVVCGIGTPRSINDHEREAYTGEFEIITQIEKNQAVGDICARYFNIQGAFIKDDHYDK